MPKLGDMLSWSANNSSGFSSSWYVQFAQNIKMDVFKAQEVFNKYGKGYIYAPGGFAMPDTPYMRRKMVANFGACVVVTSDGETWVRTPSQIGARNRKKFVRSYTKELHAIEKLEKSVMERRRVESLFYGCQGVPCPKRGGKANSQSDIGKYVNKVRRVTMGDAEVRSMPKLHVIRISI